jgi:carboxypeptidase family protein
MVSGELSRKYCCLASLALILALLGSAFGQDQDTGSIQGKVLSTHGLAIPDATVLITNTSTGQTFVVKTDAAGSFVSPALPAAPYALRTEAKAFITTTTHVTVAAGPATAAEIRLEPQPLPGIVSARSMELLPLNGRNFLQLPELQPGVQTADAGAIDPSKNGFLTLSLDQSLGRTTRVEVDDLDRIDRILGMSTQNVPASAIDEVQLGRWMGPVADQLKTADAVNFTTRSGTHDLHGDLFGFYRNGSVLSAKLPGNGDDWGRQQYGGRLGGALGDKLFFFLDAERNRQDLAQPVLLSGPFASLVPAASTLREPLREIETADRVDYQLSKNTRGFYRFGYDQLRDLHPSGTGPSLQAYLTRFNVPSHALGVDHISGDFVHSFRFEYMKLRNVSSDGSAGIPAAANPDPSLTINIGGGAISQCATGSLFCSGPNFEALRQTYQSTNQFRYDGSRVHGNHILHMGASFNRILAAQNAPFYGLAPTLSDQSTVALPAGIGISGLASDPLSYPVQWAFLGNGRGIATEKSQFGLPGGGAQDNQVMAYVGDTWKIHPDLAITYGVHWVRDTGMSDADLGGIPQLNAWGASLGNRVRQPNFNFAPQLGFSWNPGTSGSTTLRGAIGMFYDNSLFMNEFLDRPLRLSQGTYLTTPAACVGGAPGRIQWPSALVPGSTITSGSTIVGIANSDGTVSPTWCSQAIGVAGPQAVALQQAYQAATAAATTNPSFIGNPNAFAGPYQNGLSLLSPNYQTPRTVHMNIGMQHELKPGLTFTFDYVREVTTRTLLGVDVNHGGAASTFNQNNAIADRDAAQTSNGCLAGPAQVGCMVANLGPAGALAAYGAAGIGGPAQVTGGAPCPFCAFPGLHPNLGVNVMNLPEGRSVYKAINVGLKQHLIHLNTPWLPEMTFEAAYSHSRNEGQVADSSLANLATDYVNPDRFTGWDALDRTHQVSVGGFFRFQHSLQASFISHISSPLPVSLRFQQLAGGGEVLVTDLNGDGTTGDFVPGSSVGSYMRHTKATGLRSFIDSYNTNFAASANPETAAGIMLINGGVFSLADLERMGGVIQPLASPVQDVAGLGWLKTFDVRLSWEHNVQDRFTITPSIGLFNVLNFSNYDAPGNTQNGFLNYGAGSVFQSATGVQPQNTVGGNSPGGFTMRSNRTSLGSGMSAAGAPRSIEWGLKISF